MLPAIRQKQKTGKGARMPHKQFCGKGYTDTRQAAKTRRSQNKGRSTQSRVLV